MPRAVIPDSDDEIDTPEYSRSGAATPSTATTSVLGADTARKDGQDEEMSAVDEDDSEDEPVVAAGTRSVPRRSAATAASRKLSLPLPMLDLSSDLSAANDSDDDDIQIIEAPSSAQTLRKKDPKGKGKAVARQSDDDSMEYGDDSIDEEESEEDVKKIRSLAKALGKKATVRKGSGTSSPATFAVVVEGPAKKDASAKGKGKKVVAELEDGEGSALAPSPGSDIEMPSWLAEDDDEDGSDDENGGEGADAGMSNGKWGKTTLKKAPRKGAVIPRDLKVRMKKMSKFDKTQVMLKANHPELADCWEQLEALPRSVPTLAKQPGGLTQTLLPFQREGLDWMVKQEAGPFGGGMLADEMGMGKTIQTIALILSDHKQGEKKSTLVLTPTVAMVQWRNEIAKFTKGFKVYEFHGASRIDNVKELEKYDVVLTTYAVMESSFRRENKGFQKKGILMKEDSIIHKIKWHRVILDEAHNIKDRGSNTAKAAFALRAKFRWCLSGTPLQNRVGELYSLIRFIGADPFSYYFCKQCDCKSLHWLSHKGPCSECRHSGMQHVCYWNNDVLKPIQYGGSNSDEGKRAFGKLTSLLERTMLRRTKVERADDMGLPPRVVNVRRDYFNESEEELYKSLFQDVKRKFNTYASEHTILNNYSNIFTLITRMRQLADHPSLVLNSKTAMPVDHAPGDKPLDILTCRLCLDEAEDAVRTASCKHIFCRECIRQYMETAIAQFPECPTCRTPITIDLSQDALEQDTTGRQGILARIDPSKMQTSTKIEALIEELSKLKTGDHTLKSLVFSQFTTMLDLVARRLQLGGFKFVRLQGNMTPTARDRIIQYFTNTPEVTIFLISLKAGGVGLNLTEASRVFILDPWWNPAVELQAMDRIHRIGQHRPVVVTRFIIENSIESRILELQRKKENLAASALGDDDQAMGRLTPEDLRFLFSL